MTHDLDNAPPLEADFTAAVPLEIGEETAARADDLLREFAEDAGVDTALIVDRSGALVTGISSEADVTVEVISALVAGASGAMRALVSQLGETGALESLHLGGNRLIYLKETIHRFVLVAVADASRPAGLVRQKAIAVEGQLAEILQDVRPADPPPALPVSAPAKSLREVARQRAAQRVAPPLQEPVPSEPEEPVIDEARCETPPEIAPEVEEPIEVPCGGEPAIEETFETLDLQPELELALLPETEIEVPAEPVVEPAPPPPDPKKILEPLDFGEPEIVIEGSTVSFSTPPPFVKLPVDSPFETDEWEDEDFDDEENAVFEVDDEDDLPIVTVPDSVFETEDLDDEAEEAPPIAVVPPLPPFSLFEEDDGEDDDEDEVEAPEEDPARENVFEFDEGDDFEDEEAESPNPTPDPENIGREIEEMIAEEDEESEIRSSGPFYF